MIKYYNDYLRWIARWRKKPIEAWVLATRLYNQGRFREANPYYISGLEKYPEHPAAKEIRLDLAYSLFRSGDAQAAIQQLLQVYKFHPTCQETVLKLAHLQSWIGRDSDVVATISKSIIQTKPSRKLLALLAISALRLQSGQEFVEKILVQAGGISANKDERGDHLFAVAKAKFSLLKGDLHYGRKALMELCAVEHTSPEALIALSELLLIQGKVVFARQQLRRALSMVPQQPLVLALLAETYLVEAAGYRPVFALQLALSASQASSWCSPNAMYSLSKAYLLNDDSQAALMVLEKARNEMLPSLSLYRIAESIEQLWEQLTSQELMLER